MSTDVGHPLTVVSPRTGEVIALDAPTADLGVFLADVREHESLLKEAKGIVTTELLARFDRNRRWSHEGAGLKLSSPSNDPVEEFDAPALREALLTLVDAGDLTIEAVDRAIELVVEHKIHKSGINALRKGGGKVSDIIAAHSHTEERRRYIKVERA